MVLLSCGNEMAKINRLWAVDLLEGQSHQTIYSQHYFVCLYLYTVIDPLQITDTVSFLWMSTELFVLQFSTMRLLVYFLSTKSVKPHLKSVSQTAEIIFNFQFAQFIIFWVEKIWRLVCNSKLSANENKSVTLLNRSFSKDTIFKLVEVDMQINIEHLRPRTSTRWHHNAPVNQCERLHLFLEISRANTHTHVVIYNRRRYSWIWKLC